jgi:hypothetical protein
MQCKDSILIVLVLGMTSSIEEVMLLDCPPQADYRFALQELALATAFKRGINVGAERPHSLPVLSSVSPMQCKDAIPFICL